MLTLDQFIAVVETAIPRFTRNNPNVNQKRCVRHDPATPLIIVAGPGSGKTTVLVLRALCLVFVHGMMPEQVAVTTFTKKAASEIRARLIEWGLDILEHLRLTPPVAAPPTFNSWLDTVDINRFVTGTLDSLCEEVLTTHRDPTDVAPVLVEGFVGNAVFMRDGLFSVNAHTDVDLATYLATFTFDGRPPTNFGETVLISRTIIDRFVHDRVNLTSYLAAPTHAAGRARLHEAFDRYSHSMDAENMMDFARLEEVFLERLDAGRLARFTEGVRALLVDEYQDTNPLQESIYFSLIRQTNASLTLVGDDDQSLYRFRGATVELFRDFRARFVAAFPTITAPQTEYLIDNYRSTPELVGFFNDYVRIDPAFQPARVQPPKPLIVDRLPSNGVPVLGMFRPDVNTLADDMVDFLWDVFRGTGRDVVIGGDTHRITRSATGGDFGDAVLLSHTVNEVARYRNNPPRERLPLLLRRRLEGPARRVGVFNPRGRALRDIHEVQQLLGLMLECIDPPNAGFPDGVQQATLRLRGTATTYLTEWRQAARALVALNPPPTRPHGLPEFVNAWQRRRPQAPMAWPDEWPLLELCFKLVSWFPRLRDNPEGQIYLEAITRCISQAATYSGYRSMILHGNPPHDVNSVRRAVQDILVPIAEGQVDVDEEIMPHVPRSYFPMMTIHQAKGLEFPLVIVDISSDYGRDHPLTRFRRFPETPSSVCILEDDLADHCEIGPLRRSRSSLERTFDDLIRLYYVAYSRAQSVLMLVGLDHCLQYNTRVRHVATGWRSDSTWAWRRPVAGRAPALVNNIPIHLV